MIKSAAWGKVQLRHAKTRTRSPQPRANPCLLR